MFGDRIVSEFKERLDKYFFQYVEWGLSRVLYIEFIDCKKGTVYGYQYFNDWDAPGVLHSSKVYNLWYYACELEEITKEDYNECLEKNNGCYHIQY